jgi:cytochrome c
MKLRAVPNTLLVAAVVCLLPTAAGAAFNEDAARATAKRNDCFKCHAVDKTKKGPSYHKVAEKYKGKVDAEEKLFTHLTTGPKVKLEDGTEEEHKIIDTKDKAEIKNLIDWILSL